MPQKLHQKLASLNDFFLVNDLLEVCIFFGVVIPQSNVPKELSFLFCKIRNMLSKFKIFKIRSVPTIEEDVHFRCSLLLRTYTFPPHQIIDLR